MNRADLDLFRERYESLAGKVHFAADLAEAAQLLSDLVSHVQAGRIAIGALPAEARRKLLKALSGVELIDASELRANVAAEVDRADVGIGWAEFAIAFTGTIVEGTENDAMRLVSSLPRVHIALLPATEVVANLEDAAPRLRSLFDQHPAGYSVSFISGPSRTGDIEMKLVLGVHGPQASHVIVFGVPQA